ncbi:MAG: hypothetical protein LC104_04740 [Bacteroidales bacterium]|nr:hypothetical protein [Bacteroidales bacterium]
MDTIRQRLESDDHRAYLQAVRELHNLPQDEVVNMIWAIAESHTGRVKARMMNPLRDYSPELANKLALQILDDVVSEYHADALYTLWKTRSRDGIAPASIMLVTHPDATVRLSCANYLGECGTGEQIPVLQQVLDVQGTDEEGRKVCDIAKAAIAAITERENARGES